MTQRLTSRSNLVTADDAATASDVSRETHLPSRLSRSDLVDLADRLVRGLLLPDEVQRVAQALKRTADSEQPGATLARELGIPRNRRSPAKIVRDQALVNLTEHGRYRGLCGKPLYARVAHDLTVYASTATWRRDRDASECPYAASDWHAAAWRVLTVGQHVPGWKTIKRARGQVFVGHGDRAS